MSRRSRTLQLATRGSDLARRQAGAVKEALADRRLTVDLLEVETTGDRMGDELIHRLGKIGAFVHSLDKRVLDGEADAAVHSLKDVPTEAREDLVVAAVPERGPAGDVLVTPEATTLADLPAGATVGTSSLRRTAQLLAERPDLAVEPLRGNVDTRVQKLLAPTLAADHAARLEAAESATESEEEHDAEQRFEMSVEAWFDELAEIERQALEREVDTEYDAIVLAEAGLQRLGLAHHLEYERLPPDTFVPAPGQGTIAVIARDGPVSERIRDAIDDSRTRVEATVERTILETLGGGCIAPIGVRALFQGRVVTTSVSVLSGDGTEAITDRRTLPVERHIEAAREMAEDLADRGASELIDGARQRAEEDE